MCTLSSQSQLPYDQLPPLTFDQFYDQVSSSDISPLENADGREAVEVTFPYVRPHPRVHICLLRNIQSVVIKSACCCN